MSTYIAIFSEVPELAWASIINNKPSSYKNITVWNDELTRVNLDTFFWFVYGRPCHRYLTKDFKNNFDLTIDPTKNYDVIVAGSSWVENNMQRTPLLPNRLQGVRYYNQPIKPIKQNVINYFKILDGFGNRQKKMNSYVGLTDFIAKEIGTNND